MADTIKTMRFYIETNPAINEWTASERAEGGATGLFLPNGFCVFGFLAFRKLYAIIVCNIAFGVDASSESEQ